MLHGEPPSLSPDLCRHLQAALSTATPQWVRVHVDSRPGGYRLRLRGRWPPHLHSKGMTARGTHDPLECVREILGEVQRFVGKALDMAWPSEAPLPQVTGPLHETAVAWYGPRSAPELSLPPIPLDRP